MTMVWRPGTLVGKYRVVELLGCGAMGVVYRARDETLLRDVAIKVLELGEMPDPAASRRLFARELRAVARLAHPNIITLYDHSESDGRPFMVMELVRGVELRELIDNGAPLSMTERLALMAQICDGLHHAHQHNVVHRDVKPSNILVVEGNVAKILDFGIARLTDRKSTVAGGGLIGTPSYLSPQHLTRETLDGRADIFAAGIVLYELLLHRRPFTGASMLDLFRAIALHPPAPLTDEERAWLPSGVTDVIDRALRKAVEERYQTAEEMAGALRSLVLPAGANVAATAPRRSPGSMDDSGRTTRPWFRPGGVRGREHEDRSETELRVAPEPGPSGVDRPLRDDETTIRSGTD